MTHFGTLREGRAHLNEILDAAAGGRPTSVTVGPTRVALIDADRWATVILLVRPAHAQVLFEGDGWSISVPGLPIAAAGASLDEALDENVSALRDYAEAWSQRLRLARNHTENWITAQLVEVSSDERLKAWLQGHDPVAFR